VYNKILNEFNNISFCTLDKYLKELELLCLAVHIKNKFPLDKRSIKEIKSIICEEYNIPPLEV